MAKFYFSSTILSNDVDSVASMMNKSERFKLIIEKYENSVRKEKQLLLEIVLSKNEGMDFRIYREVIQKYKKKIKEDIASYKEDPLIWVYKEDLMRTFQYTKCLKITLYKENLLTWVYVKELISKFLYTKLKSKVPFKVLSRISTLRRIL
jgi:hypothetical protein